ncbi:hypothetical protein GOBAR_AA12627 [Gossypium barbadense]|uniref:Uncharacterized protein n=1 Tax=Gossypium barbadense TaxID=3634 RepID=A0A2P5XXK0_GOSBA|nr:hypothetical protein GOBAR_AA12627 [Gossypium barbadense]
MQQKQSDSQRIDELDEWRTHVKEKPKSHDESKRHHDKRRDETNQFKVGEKVLSDERDPRIATSELLTKGATPLRYLMSSHTVQLRYIILNSALSSYSGPHGLDTQVCPWPCGKKAKNPQVLSHTAINSIHTTRTQGRVLSRAKTGAKFLNL